MRRLLWSFLVVCTVTLPCTAQQAESLESANQNHGDVELLTDPRGVNFTPYLAKILETVRLNWYSLLSDPWHKPQLSSGENAVQFKISPDGKISGMQLSKSSRDVALDRAAWGAITASNPFPALPKEFTGPFIALRLHFHYKPQKKDTKKKGD